MARRLPWRARCYWPGAPGNVRVRAFASEPAASAWAARWRLLGLATEVWEIVPMEGV